MENSNVIDFFTRQSFKEITTKETRNNDDLTSKHGIYLGCLGANDCAKLRSMNFELDFKREQIGHLTTEWEQIYSVYHTLLSYCLEYLNNPHLKKIDFNVDTVSISEDGHAWVIYNYREIEEW